MVVLGGKARDVPAHVHAVGIVDRIEGVRRVETRVEVENQQPVVAERRTGGRRDMSNPTLSDAWLTTQIKLKLIGNEHVPSPDVHIDTDNGVVTLWGKVDTDRAKSEANKEAQSVEGVTRVHNDLVVDASMRQATVADKDIEQDVKRILSNEAMENVAVDVKNGVIKLSGKVDSQSKKVRAAMTSRTVRGARAVKDDLKVERQEK